MNKWWDVLAGFVLGTGFGILCVVSQWALPTALACIAGVIIVIVSVARVVAKVLVSEE